MNATQTLTVYAPASVGNVSVGFDSIGLALAPVDGSLLGDQVTLKQGQSGDWVLHTSGPFAPDLPPDPENDIALASCRRFQQACARFDLPVTPLEVYLDKQLPVGSGLGSSASSIVATLEALNRWFDHALTARQLLELMAEMEGKISGEIHLDNIAPCVYGGLRLCPPGNTAEYALPWPAAWRAVVCWPGTKLVTRQARAVLPDSIPRTVAVQHGAQFAQFVHALHTGDSRTAGACMRELIAEPYRRDLLPGFDHAREALTAVGALAVGISGSGPTLIAIVDDFDVANNTQRWLAENYVRNARGFVRICRADLGGARSIEPVEGADSRLP